MSASSTPSLKRTQSNSTILIDPVNKRTSKRLTNRLSSRTSDVLDKQTCVDSASRRATNRLSSRRPVSSEGFNKAHIAHEAISIRHINNSSSAHSIAPIAPVAVMRSMRSYRSNEHPSSARNTSQLVTDQPFNAQQADRVDASTPINTTDRSAASPIAHPMMIVSPSIDQIKGEIRARSSPYRLSMIDMQDAALLKQQEATDVPLSTSQSFSQPDIILNSSSDDQESSVQMIDERLRGEELHHLSDTPNARSIGRLMSSRSTASFPAPNQQGNVDVVPSSTSTKPVESSQEHQSTCQKFITTAIGTLVLSVIYLPFTLAILLQSTYQRKPILPANHASELSIKFWIIALVIFASMIIFPFIMNFAVLTNTGLWSMFNNNVVEAIPFTFCFAFYLFLLSCLHLMTLHYTYMRPDLRIIHNDNQAINLQPWSTWLCIFSIIFETFQLNAPYLSARQLGLEHIDDGYAGWLGSINDGFGISEWRFTMKTSSVIPSFWAAFSIVVVYSLMLGYGIVSDLQPTYRLGWLLFELIPGILYLTISARLLQPFNCQPDASTGAYYLTNDPSVQCWSTFYHRSLTMAAFMALLFYSSVAMFVAAYRGDAAGHPENVKFKPVYLVSERTLRGLFAITTTLISDIQLGRALGIVIVFVLLMTTLITQPCSVPTIGRFKALSHFTAFWLLSCSFLPAIFRSVTNWFDEQVPVLIVSGWIVFLLIYGCLELNDYFTRRLALHSGTKRTPVHATRTRSVAPSPTLAEDVSETRHITDV